MAGCCQNECLIAKKEMAFLAKRMHAQKSAQKYKRKDGFRMLLFSPTEGKARNFYKSSSVDTVQLKHSRKNKSLLLHKDNGKKSAAGFESQRDTKK